MSFPRPLAVQILTSVLSEGQSLPQALLKADQARVSSEDRSWLTEICSGVLRWKGRLDLAIDSAALKKKPSGWLRKILLIGAYQLIAQEKVHPALVVSETVSEIKKREGDAPARFANAVLRKISATAESWRELSFPNNRAALEQAAWASLPEWFWKRIVSAHGEDWSRRFAEASLQRPKVWLRVAGESSPQEASAGRISLQDGFADGKFFVQDVSSQLLVSEIARVVKASSSQLRVLDLCSAPGGKSIGLSWEGFDVAATDLDPRRLALVRENAERLHRHTELSGGVVRVIDRGEVAALAPLDLVWVDAPCTGSGIIRRHPDVRWLRKERDLESLPGVQRELIREAWGKVRRGGYLAYSVCSVFHEEGAEVIRGAGLEKSVVQTWALAPHEAPYGDGFWAALVLRVD